MSAKVLDSRKRGDPDRQRRVHPRESGCSEGYRNALSVLPENAGTAVRAGHCGIPVTTAANLENMTESGAILSELS